MNSARPALKLVYKQESGILNLEEMSEIQEFHTTKEIKDILNKCRCCLRLIIDDRRAVDINENIRDQFYNLTKIQVIFSHH